MPRAAHIRSTTGCATGRGADAAIARQPSFALEQRTSAAVWPVTSDGRASAGGVVGAAVGGASVVGASVAGASGWAGAFGSVTVPKSELFVALGSIAMGWSATSAALSAWAD
jgi:hypothetical protein